MIDAHIVGALLLGVFFVLMILRVPIAIALSLSSILTLLLCGLAPAMFADIMEASVSSIALLSIPFFIIAGNVMDQAGISGRIVRFVEAMVGSIPGGIGIVSVVVVTFWGAISGSGPATVVALGPVLVPLMVKSHYPAAFAGALVAAASGIAVIIPPSITFIVYGVVADGVSVGRQFAAGILPGIIMGGCFCIYTFIYSLRHGIKGRGRCGWREKLTAFGGCFWGLLSPVIILGGIYGGIFTPTEAAAVAAIYSLLVGVFIYKTIKGPQLIDIMISSTNGAGMILLISAGAGVMAWLVTFAGVAEVVTSLLLSVSTNPTIVVLMIFVILLIAGFFLDGISITYLFVPLLLPTALRLGYEATWFGVILVIAVAIGMITPPVAGNLYPAAQISNVPLHTISREIVGFAVTGVAAGLVMLFFPEISVFLPNLWGL
ncbi:MAG: TRAP transporter large permease [Spirochaetales bacterium]|jgi:C4-dicarboxylate transporter DctM subunit|nr:TRAP transporter large permease [Spirochaetales bacterium]